MVSFQCLGCGDVVKKPKLDNHRARCYTGFDCIDCSKTFQSPAEYKGHTTCISEAEKYQKSLYKGPKTDANGLKSINSIHQSNSPLDKKDIATTPAPRQSNAQWNRNSQLSSVDNVNGYPGQHQPQQNGWQNGRDRHRYGDRGRNGSNWQQNKYTRSSASGANDTPLGISRRSSVDAPVVVNESGDSGPGSRADGASQENSQVEETEAKGKPRKEKRKSKLVGDNSSAQTGKEKPTEPDTAKAVHNDVKEDNERRKKKEVNGEASPARSTEADSDIKEKIKKEKKRREKAEQGLADTEGSEDKRPSKKEKKRKEVTDEPNSVDDGGVGSDDKKRKKEKKRKEKIADDNDKAVNLEIPASTDDQTTKTKKKRNKKAATDDIAGDSETPVVEKSTAEDVVMSAPVHDQTTKKKKKRTTTDTIAETHVDKQRARGEKEVVQEDTGVDSKEKKRKGLEEPNGTTKKKKRKHNSES